MLTDKDVIEWDTVNWLHCLRFWEARISDGAGKLALEVGARRGGLSAWMAQKGYAVVCSDLTSPESMAAPFHRAAGVSSRISYEAIDATAIPYENKFDVVVFKSVLGGVGRDAHRERQALAVAQMYKALKPGGLLLFAENLVASPLHIFLRSHYVSWGNSWRYVREGEMKDFLGDFSEISMQTHGFLGSFGRNEMQRTLLGHIDSIMSPIVPSSYRYIVFGVAKKQGVAFAAEPGSRNGAVNHPAK